MRKWSVIFLSVFVIFACGWTITNQIDHLDILPNYTETYLSEHKERIRKDPKLDDCEKKTEIKLLEQRRQIEKEQSQPASLIVLFCIGVIVVQLVIVGITIWPSQKG